MRACYPPITQGRPLKAVAQLREQNGREIKGSGLTSLMEGLVLVKGIGFYLLPNEGRGDDQVRRNPDSGCRRCWRRRHCTPRRQFGSQGYFVGEGCFGS